MLEGVRVANIALTSFGAAVFAALLAYVFFAPGDFDRRTRQISIEIVQTKTKGVLRDIAYSDKAESVAEFAGIFSDRLENEINELRANVDAGIPQLIVDILAAACRLDCERKEAAEKSILTFYAAIIERYGNALERARNLVVAEYDTVMDELRGDMKIFAGSSFLAFVAALVLAIFKGRAAAHLLPISIALSMATVLAIIWYVFGQDWVMAIIFNDYWGWSYAALIGIIWTFLADIAVNKARVTTFILNGLGNAIGPVNLSPC